MIRRANSIIITLFFFYLYSLTLYKRRVFLIGDSLLSVNRMNILSGYFLSIPIQNNEFKCAYIYDWKIDFFFYGIAHRKIILIMGSFPYGE